MAVGLPRARPQKHFSDRHRTIWCSGGYKGVVGSNALAGEDGQGFPRSELSESSDADLRIEIGDGDKGSLEQLYRRHGLYLAALMARMFDDHQMAEEVVQDTFLAVWGGARFDGRSRVRTWLVAIAIRQAKSRRRRRRFPVGNHVDDPVSDEPDPESRAIASLEADRMIEDLSGLTRIQRQILLLTFAEELTQPEIAELLGVRLGTVKSRVHSAKVAMQRKWEREDRQ